MYVHKGMNRMRKSLKKTLSMQIAIHRGKSTHDVLRSVLNAMLCCNANAELSCNNVVVREPSSKHIPGGLDGPDDDDSSLVMHVAWPPQALAVTMYAWAADGVNESENLAWETDAAAAPRRMIFADPI